MTQTHKHKTSKERHKYACIQICSSFSGKVWKNNNLCSWVVIHMRLLRVWPSRIFTTSKDPMSLWTTCSNTQSHSHLVCLFEVCCCCFVCFCLNLHWIETSHMELALATVPKEVVARLPSHEGVRHGAASMKQREKQREEGVGRREERRKGGLDMCTFQ